MKPSNSIFILIFILFSGCSSFNKNELRGTGDLGVIIERSHGSVLIIENITNTVIGRVEGLGDLSHASVVFHRSGQFAYVFARDGGLTKIDLLQKKIIHRIIQGGNSIGGAISQDSQFVAVSNYVPGGIKIFSADDLKLIADIPAEYEPQKFSKTVGLVDAPGNQFVYSLFEGGQIWLTKIEKDKSVSVKKFSNAGKEPYDGLVSPDGRYYLAGLFGETGIAMIDLWNPDRGSQKVIQNYGKEDPRMPVYKMPHFEGWSMCGDYAIIPGVGHHEVILVNRSSWQEVKRIPTHGQPVFAMADPQCRNILINFALPNNDTLQVLSLEKMQITKTMKLGPGILHMEFTPKGHQVWVSVRDMNEVQVFETENWTNVKTIPALNPSGIFFTNRAHKIGL